MEMNAWRDVVGRFVSENGLSQEPHVRLHGLVSEVGELAKEILKGTAYGKAPFVPSEEWSMELGDVLFSVLALAAATDVDLQATLVNALEKYSDRIGRHGHPGSKAE